ncbi:MAG: NAD(P)-dependent alcohol dehydrogenase [Thermoplasmata archaeon]|nr:NAD(P)-dependent alcohol dehydrogenase [Thermoplasmata archaeon]MCI4356593.1 NAD(P)-dependent alcohol dehydrogenase [Thermoplasmata archaeon]
MFGVAEGAFAEYVSAAEKEIALKPANVSFEAAATCGIAAFTALQGLRDTGQVGAGRTVLINGAGGGVGTFAVQIAKSMGAEVTASTSQENLSMVRGIGADHALDYAKEDFGAGGRTFDVILDTHPRRSISQYQKALNPGGVAILVGFSGMFRLLGIMVRSKLTSKTTGRRVAFLVAKPNKKDIEAIGGLLRDGKLLPVIDRRYSLDQVADAVRYLESERARGKIVITVVGESPSA